jgi:SOS-response transcriptional repressor LexA
MKELTAQQDKLHAYLCSRWHNPPTVREMAEHMGGVNVNCVMGHLKALRTKGFIRGPEAGRARSIELLIGPDLDGSTIEIAGRTYRLHKEESC